MNTELRLKHTIEGSNKHGRSAKDIRFTDLVKITCQEITSGSNVQSKITTCYRNRTQQDKAWRESTQIIEQNSLTDQKPKRIRRYDGTHVNITSFINRFRLCRKLDMTKTELGRHVCERDALNTRHCMTIQAYYQQEDMIKKLNMARTISQHAWINYNNLGKID